MENDEELPTNKPSDDEGAPGASTRAGTPTDRPLGYWLRLVDALITREFASTLETEGVGRRDWMLLNVLSGTIDAPGFAERLARRGKHLRRLEERGWVAQAGDGSWTLTDDGRAAQERLSGLVAGIREKVADAVTPEQFATLTASLEAIARELGWDEKDAWPAGGFRGRGFGPGFGGFGGGFGPRFGGFGPGRGRGPWHGFAPDGSDDADGSPHPRPMDGPNLHRGFGPGGGPRHPHGFDRGHGRGYGFDRGYGYEHGGDAEACGHPHHGHGHGFEHGQGQHDHPHDHRGGGKGRRAAEHAYERGFTAGFEAGRRPGTVDPAA